MTTKAKINEILNADFYGHPSREPENDIKKIKKAILILAEKIDFINEYGQFQ